jgi:hypothetical protein
LDNATEGLDDAMREKVIIAVYSDSLSNPLFEYIGSNKRMLVVLDELQQGELQATGGTMTDGEFKAFTDILIQLTGLSVHERQSTLNKLTEGSMPSFTVSDVEVSIKGKKVSNK